MDVIKMQAAGDKGTYIVALVVDGEFVTGAQAIGPAPANIRNICKYFDKQQTRVKSGPVTAIRTEMERCGKFIGEFQ